MEYGVLSVEYGVLSVEYGVHEYGVRSTAPELGVHGLWSMEYCRWRNPCQGLRARGDTNRQL